MVEFFPVFDLYGESARRPSLDAIHVETLFARSHEHDWEIRPHRHADLHQVFWLTRGGGTVLCDGAEERIRARTAILVPRGAVHGFHWEPESEGYVLTLWAPFLAAFEPIAGRIANAFAERAIAPFAGRTALSRAMDHAFELLMAEFRQSDVGRTGVMAGLVSQILAYVQRGLALSRSAQHAADGSADLARRFEGLVEERFARQDAIDVYCRELGVSNSSLVRACRTMLDRSPLEVVNDRVLLEAKRLLIYTGLSVSEAAYALGFADPAYFSRFFKLRERVSPQQFRSGATRSNARTRLGKGA
jgi:AraC family transcriptional activator of pobA